MRARVSGPIGAGLPASGQQRLFLGTAWSLEIWKDAGGTMIRRFAGLKFPCHPEVRVVCVRRISMDSSTSAVALALRCGQDAGTAAGRRRYEYRPLTSVIQMH